MTSILANGKIAALIAGATTKANITEPVTLHLRDAGTDLDGVPTATFVDYTLTATPLEISRFRRDVGRVPDTDTDVIVYQVGATATPRTGDEMTVRAQRYEVLSVTSDPAGATWTCRLRRKP